MSATSDRRQVETRGEPLLGLMAAGVVVLTGLISTIDVFGTWWALGAVFATLLATVVVVVIAIGRYLGDLGDGDGAATAPDERLAAATPAVRETSLPTPRPPMRALPGH